MLRALASDVFSSVPRVVGEERDSPEGVCDECKRGEASHLPGVRWHRSCDGCYRISPVESNALPCGNHKRTEFWRGTACSQKKEKQPVAASRSCKAPLVRALGSAS